MRDPTQRYYHRPPIAVWYSDLVDRETGLRLELAAEVLGVPPLKLYEAVAKTYRARTAPFCAVPRMPVGAGRRNAGDVHVAVNDLVAATLWIRAHTLGHGAALDEKLARLDAAWTLLLLEKDDG